ncbi:MAG: hypothetical protein ACOZNI_13715 [Myxococcota bacterium]
MLLSRIFLSFLGCSPTCEQVCEKLVDCENEGTERMTATECELSCDEQEDLYDRWTDEQKRDAFEAELQCIQESACEEIAEGACYDPEVWTF